MTRLGLCISANGSVPDAVECAALGLGAGDWVRTAVAGPLSLLDGMLERIGPSVAVMVTLNNQCDEVRGDWSGWEDACAVIARRYNGRVALVGCGNELDLWHWQPPGGGPGDPSLTPVFAASLVRRAAPILRPVGIKVAMSSVASGRWPEYLRAMAVACDGAAEYSDLHLYAKILNGIPAGVDWQTAAAALHQARTLSGLPVISSEAGIKVDDAGGLDAQARWAFGLKDLPAEFVCYWCWHDQMASPGEIGGQAFGLRALSGGQKPVWFSLQRLLGGPAPGDPYYVGPGLRALLDARGWQALSREDYFNAGASATLIRTDQGLRIAYYWKTTQKIYLSPVEQV